VVANAGGPDHGLDMDYEMDDPLELTLLDLAEPAQPERKCPGCGGKPGVGGGSLWGERGRNGSGHLFKRNAIAIWSQWALPRLYQVIIVLVLMVAELLAAVHTQLQFCGISAIVVTWTRYRSRHHF
jgi:hypothetical protein